MTRSEARFDSYKDVRLRYFAIAQEMVNRHPNGDFLKTDCYNEAEVDKGAPSIIKYLDGYGRFTLIEADAEYVETAREKLKHLSHTEVEKGDVRAIHSPKSCYDGIIDLSTIDHIAPEDVPLALGEYRRVLKDDGEVSVVVWLDDTASVPGGEWTPKWQCVFAEEWFDAQVQQFFTIERKDVLIVGQVVPGKGKSRLTEYLLKVK